MALKMKRAERTVQVCLDGSLVAEHEEVTAKLEDLQKRKMVDKRLNDPAIALEKRQAELWEQQQAETVVFRLQALPRNKWSEVKGDHPPRKDNAVDEHYGFNTDTMFDAVMGLEGVIVEVKQAGQPVKFTGKDWADFAKELSVGQYAEFQVALRDLNTGDSSVPFSYAGYKRIKDSGGSSK